jgi:hypothetical protein
VNGAKLAAGFAIAFLVPTPTRLLAGDDGPLVVHGVASGRIFGVESQTSWIEGGYGRLTEGAPDGPDDRNAGLRGQFHLGVDLKFSEVLRIHAHGVLHGEPSSYGGDTVGLPEAFLEWRPELGPRTTLRFRAGLFFPPTSLENTDELWQSPYTVTLSALNTWIGEEVRLTGLDTQLTRKVGDDGRLDLAGAAFAVNDPGGALLAWRGWAFGERLTGLGEVLPLPPLASLKPGGAFEEQRADGTTPVNELDDRLGWHARVKYTEPQRFALQAAYYDNRADRELYRGQYAWATRFAQVGLDLRLGSHLSLVGEWAQGDTGMGVKDPAVGHVDVRFQAGYGLVSWHTKAVRLTGRVDYFENQDRDHTAEPDHEDGWGFTVAGFWQPKPYLRIGLEYLDVRAERPAAAFSGGDPDTNARRGQAELRLRF